MAYSARTPTFLARHPELVDYVEVPFEMLRHNPATFDLLANVPVVLHCASLSVAGSVPPKPEVLDEVAGWAVRTGTPWIGEHLSFILADRELAGPSADPYAPGEPWNIGYTVSPQLTEQTLDRVVAALAAAEAKLPAPLLLENPPIYFPIPGSTMTQVQFVAELCQRTEIGLLLDLAHFYITARNLGLDPVEQLAGYPVERVVEVHLSGLDEEAGSLWDNHAARAPQAELDLLELVLARASVRAVTLEYNWSTQFPETVLLAELDRVHSVTAAVSVG